jgi:hypothetical protein
LTLAAYVISLREREIRMHKFSRSALFLAILAVAVLVSSCADILLKNNASLSTLSVQSDDGTVLTLTPTFDPLTLNYTASVAKAAKSLTITATPTYSGATVSVPETATGPATGTFTGVRTIIDATTEIDVYVRAANDEGSTQKYIVIITQASE